MTLQGIDAQGRVTQWSNVVGSGVTFAIFRCVGENGKIDPDYAPNVKAAHASGVIPGGYHFIAGGGTVVEHCKRFVGTMGDPMGLLVAVDVERPNHHDSPKFADVQRWFDEYRKHHPTHPVLLYTGRWFWHPKSFGNPDGSGLSPHSWGSFYPKHPDSGRLSAGWNRPFGGWDGPTIWQYRGGGKLVNGKGAGARVDLNAYRGSLDDLRALASRTDVNLEDTVIFVDLDRFPDGQRRVTGTNVTLFLPDRRTKQVPNLASFANARAAITRSDNAAPKGAGWLRLSAKPHAGWFVPEAMVTIDAIGAGGPPDDDLDQTDLDRASEAATADERGRWLTWVERHPTPNAAPAGNALAADLAVAAASAERGRWETWLADRPSEDAPPP